MVLQGLYVKPDTKSKTANVSFEAPRVPSRVAWEVSLGGGRVSAGVLEPASKRVFFEISMPGFRPWSVDSPELYTLGLDVDFGDGAVSASEKFGMYSIEAGDGRLYFNGSLLYIRGVIRGREAHDHPNLLGLDEEEYYARYIRRAKEYGFNFVRFHSRIPPESYFRAADRIGMLTHVEIRPYYGKYQKERRLLDRKKELVKEDEWRAAILSIRNHPSVLVYCLGNEIDAPGRNPEVGKLYRIAKELDPERLFLDTCSRGEFDRENVDLDVQHMSYYAPFGKNYRMFETPEHTNIYGSCRGLEMEAGDASARTVRHVSRPWPLLAHEVCHYAALRDIDRLDEDFSAAAEKPWWIGELKKLRSLKGVEDYYGTLLEASRRYQFIWWKQCLESVRRSPLLQGFHMLQLSDTERYENSNGLLDPFDEPHAVSPDEFLRFNSGAVLLADVPRRCFSAGEEVEIPVMLSHYDGELEGEAALEWSIRERGKEENLLSGSMGNFSMSPQGLRKLCTIKAVMPDEGLSLALELDIRLLPGKGRALENSWNLWVFGGGGAAVPGPGRSLVEDLKFRAFYPPGGARGGDRLLAARTFSEEVFEHLDAGGDVLMLYRPRETRDRGAPREKYYLPSTRDRFKPVIWDRGHNCGAFMRKHPLWTNFPNDGFVDFSFANLVDDADKMDISDFPVRVNPAMEGVDKAVRDRYDVNKFGLRELQPGWTMRRFAYIFEIRAGKGRMLLSGLNFARLGSAGAPEVKAMLDGLLSYLRSENFRPEQSIEVKELKDYLEAKGRAPRIKERMMTQFWQLDDAPLETPEFWRESEAWLRE